MTELIRKKDKDRFNKRKVHYKIMEAEKKQEK